MLPFVGVDGEGGDITDDTGFTTHTYTMLRAGNEYVTDNWLRFLGELPKKQIFVSYYFDYDVTMMLRDMPESLLKALMTGIDVQWNAFKLSYRPRKEFVVHYRGHRTTINDVGTFFQTKFLNALKQWEIGTSQQHELIGEGKEGRATFGALTADTIRYNAMECDLLEKLMEKFRHTCQVIGYLPSRWQGPGQLAKAMFKHHGIPKTDELPEPPPGVWEMAQAAYYGGRFETSAVGHVRGPIDGWDINSAYPYAATQLPCLVHGRWRPTRSIHQTGMYRVRFTHTREQTWYSLPVRTSTGAIQYPRSGSGWYHGCELLSAQRLNCQLTVLNGWEIVTECDCRLFDFNHRLYSVRKAVGKTQAGIALKLAMNSQYGVTAQSIGKAPYANPVWAGLFTAITRARINEALALDPHAVYMVATDGLFAAAGALPLVESATLGGWERTTYPDMFIVQPGVYFAGAKPPKTRGVPQTAIMREEEALREAWHGKRTDGLPISLRQFIGLRLAVARNAVHTAGQWMPVTKTLSYDWSTKRQPNILRPGTHAQRTIPYPGDVDVWSIPYDRMIGGNLARDMDRLQFADTPDWAEVLTEVL